MAHSSSISTLPATSSITAHEKILPCSRWFITRTDGVLVPLVAVDELPPGYDLDGVPRSISIETANGMEFLGKFPKPRTYIGLRKQPPQRYWSLQPTQRFSRPAETPDPRLRQFSSTNRMGSAIETSNSIVGPQRSQSQHGERTQAVIDAIVRSEASAGSRSRYPFSRPPPPSGTEPDQDKKEYCTYWIRTGECDYTQQGCLYKHEMPDKATLQKVGFRSVPRWWQEKQLSNLSARLGRDTGRSGPWTQKPRASSAEKDGSEFGSRSDYDDSSPCSSVQVDKPASVKSRREFVTTRPSNGAIQPYDQRERQEPNEEDPVGDTLGDDLINFSPLVPAPAPTHRRDSSGSFVSPPETLVPQFNRRVATSTSTPTAFRKSAFMSAKKSPFANSTTTSRAMFTENVIEDPTEQFPPDIKGPERMYPRKSEEPRSSFEDFAPASEAAKAIGRPNPHEAHRPLEGRGTSTMNINEKSGLDLDVVRQYIEAMQDQGRTIPEDIADRLRQKIAGLEESKHATLQARQPLATETKSNGKGKGRRGGSETRSRVPFRYQYMNNNSTASRDEMGRNQGTGKSK